MHEAAEHVVRVDDTSPWSQGSGPWQRVWWSCTCGATGSHIATAGTPAGRRREALGVHLHRLRKEVNCG